MIKRFRIAPMGAAQGAGAPWERAATAAAAAPAGVAPVRMAACHLVEELSTDPPCRAIGIEWFSDGSHLERFDGWVGAHPEILGPARSTGAADATAGVVVADEQVMRGSDWLEQRWRDGGEVLKQMALARRAAGLSPAEFSERWKGRAGTVSTAGGATVAIPEAARGRAYIQNHPCPPGDWPYDALNEVYFDDLGALRSRIDWFAEHMQAGAEQDLVSEASFVVFREIPLG